MFRDDDINEWLSSLEEGDKALIALACSREDWPVDDDPQVHSLLNEFSDALNYEAGSVKGDQSPEDMLAAFKHMDEVMSKVDTPTWLELQGQFSFPRGIKLFSQLCMFSPEKAQEILTAGRGAENEALLISSGNLVTRLLYLGRMQLIRKIFCDPRMYDAMQDSLLQFFQKDASHEKN